MLEPLIDYIYTVFEKYGDNFPNVPILNVIKKYIKDNEYDIEITDENKDEALAEIAELRYEWERLHEES